MDNWSPSSSNFVWYWITQREHGNCASLTKMHYFPLCPLRPLWFESMQVRGTQDTKIRHRATVLQTKTREASSPPAPKSFFRPIRSLRDLLNLNRRTVVGRIARTARSR